MRIVVSHIWPGGTLVRRSVDTARHSGGIQWDELVEQGLAVPPPYRAFPGSPVCHIQVDDQVVVVTEHELTGPLLDLVTAVLAVGEVILAAPARPRSWRPLPHWAMTVTEVQTASSGLGWQRFAHSKLAAVRPSKAERHNRWSARFTWGASDRTC